MLLLFSNTHVGFYGPPQNVAVLNFFHFGINVFVAKLFADKHSIKPNTHELFLISSGLCRTNEA